MMNHGSVNQVKGLKLNLIVTETVGVKLLFNFTIPSNIMYRRNIIILTYCIDMLPEKFCITGNQHNSNVTIQYIDFSYITDKSTTVSINYWPFEPRSYFA